MLELPRGMKDFDTKDTSEIEHVRYHFKRISDLYGFSFMDPSPIESLETLETKSGPAIRDEIYYFTDKGQREIALRFDLTMGLTRYVSSQRSLKLPIKISSFGGVFRYDEPQKGRYRYFHQWDLEVYGKKTVETDAELVEMTSRLFDSLLLHNIVIDINHRNLVESFIIQVFDSSSPELISDMLHAIDKTAKKSRDAILAEFIAKGYDSSKLNKILDFAKLCGTISHIKSQIDTSQLQSWDELELLFTSLESRGISNVRINFGIVRGLDYYSGMVFEVFDKDSKLGALAGGGRYDALTAAFGRDDIGAAGVAGGVERIILTMHEQKLFTNTQETRIAVIYVNNDMQNLAHSIASLLRLNNIPTDIDLVGRNIKKQFEHATNTRYAIVIGPNELKEGNVLLHDMQDGKEGTISIEQLTQNPRSVLNLEKLS